MKKLLPLFFLILFPYFLFAMVCIVFVLSWEPIFHNSNLMFIVLLFSIYLITFICAIIVIIKYIIKKQNDEEIFSTTMAIKLMHIPFYIITVDISGVGIAFNILDCMTIFLTGSIGLSGLIRSYTRKILPLRTVLLFGIFQFIFFIDAISSVVLYEKTRL